MRHTAKGFSFTAGPKGTSTWLLYAVVMAALACLFFFRVIDHPIDVDDDRYLKDSATISADLSHLWSAEKHFPGRPTVELVIWLGYILWGDEIHFFHLLVVSVHLLASLLLAVVAQKTGLNIRTSMLGGLLFLTNVAHFRSVYWVSAIAYPLALLGTLAAVLCLLRHFRCGGAGWLIGSYAALLVGVFAHASAVMGWFACLYLARLEEDKFWTFRLLPLGVLCGSSVYGLIHFFPTAPQVTQHADGINLLDGAWVLLWMWSRLLTTAHWLPLCLYQLQTWELWVGLTAFICWLIAAHKRIEPVALWGGWVVLFTLPFVVRSTDFFLGIATGPSRFLYVASAGSSMILAWLLLRGVATGCIQVATLTALLLSSWFALGKAEYASFYTAGRYSFFNAAFNDDPDLVERGIGDLTRAIEGNADVVPLGDAYFSLALLLIEEGSHVNPWVEQGLKRVPQSIELNTLRELLDSGATGVPALAENERASDLRRRNPGVFFGALAAIYHRMGKGMFKREEYAGTVAALERSLHFDEMAWANGVEKSGVLHHKLIRLGVAHNRLAQHQEALRYYERVIRERPEQAVARFNLGATHYLLGNTEQTRRQYQVLIDVDVEMGRRLGALIGEGLPRQEDVGD